MFYSFTKPVDFIDTTAVLDKVFTGSEIIGFTMLYEKNDAAHDFSHALAVCREALNYSKVFGDEFVRCGRLILLACLAHDCMTHIDRDTHHILAAEYVRNHFRRIKGYEIACEAIEQHRSSFKGERSSLVSKVLFCADKGKPDCAKYIDRAVMYRLGKEGSEDCVTLIDSAIEHIREKFGKESDIWKNFPEEYFLLYKKELEKFWFELNDPSWCLAYKNTMSAKIK